MYALTEEYFYSKLGREYEVLMKYVLKMVLVDANAYIGRKYIFQSTIGKYSRTFEKEDNVIIKSLYF